MTFGPRLRDSSLQEAVEDGNELSPSALFFQALMNYRRQSRKALVSRLREDDYVGAKGVVPQTVARATVGLHLAFL